MVKIPKLSNFQTLYAFFSKISTNFVDWNVEKGQKGNNVLSSRLFEEFLAVFQVKMSQIDTENHKKPKVFQFSKFLCIFC